MLILLLLYSVIAEVSSLVTTLLNTKHKYLDVQLGNCTGNINIGTKYRRTCLKPTRARKGGVSVFCFPIVVLQVTPSIFQFPDVVINDYKEQSIVINNQCHGSWVLVKESAHRNYKLRFDD